MIVLGFCILLSMFVSLMGAKEAILYSKKGDQAFRWNEHYLYDVERLLFIGILTYMIFLLKSEYLFFICMVYFILSFTFFHDGFYYFTRSKIDVPKYRFYSDSTTSTSGFEVKWKYRLTLFILSILILIVYFLT